MPSSLPLLWILSPSCSQRLLNGFGAKLSQEENWGEGVYLLPEFQRTALVAINQLPVNQDTLWLRVLGKRRTQQQAIDELVGFPQENPQRRNILEILANWRINVGRSEMLSNADRELIMNLSPAYFKWREEAVLEGRREGMLEERRQMVEGLLLEKFGEINEELAQIIEPLMQLNTRERSQAILQLSREELLTRFRSVIGQQATLQEGRLEERRQMVENFLRVRFGELDEELEAIIAPMLQLTPQVLTRLLFSLSREELFLWFGEASGVEERFGEGKREKVENLLKVRFGEVDQELADKIASMLELPHQELTPLLLTLSREELLERFAG